MTRRPVLLFISSFFILMWLVSAQTAAASALDLSRDLTQSNVIKLHGPWDFHWQKFLEPNQIHEPATTTLFSGDSWSGQKGESIDSFGYGTYVMQISGLEPNENGYSIFVPSIIVAGRVIAFPEGDLDRKVQAAIGIPGVSAAATTASLKSVQLYIFPKSRTEVWTIMVHASNFIKQTGGGLEQPPEVAKSEVFMSKVMKGSFIEASALGFILALAIYYILIFLRQPSDKSSLALVLSCVGGILQIFSKSIYVPIVFGFPGDTNYSLSYAVNYGSVPISMLGFYLFYAQTFRMNFNRIFTVLVWLTFLMLMLISLSFDVGIMNRFVVLFQTLPGLIAVYGIALLYNAIRLGMEGARISALGFIFIFLSVVYDIGVSMNVFPYPSLFQYGLSCFLFIQGQVLAVRFAKAFNTADYLSKELQQEVKRQTSQIRNLMDNLPQGVFSINSNLKINPTYSRQLNQMLGDQDPGGRDLFEVMQSRLDVDVDILGQTYSALQASLAEDLISWELNCSLLLTECRARNGQHLEFEWHPLEKDGYLDEVLVTIRDVTEIRMLRAKSEEREREFALVQEIYGLSQQRLKRYTLQTENLIEECQRTELLESHTDSQKRRLLSLLHTLKGNSRQLGLSKMASAAHIAENDIITQPAQPERTRSTLAILAGLWKKYKETIAKLYGQENEQIHSVSFNADEWQLLEKEVHASSPSLDRIINILRKAAFPSLIDELQQSSIYAENLAKKLGKALPQIIIDIPDIPLGSQQREALQKIWVHLVNNSLDHGIEAPDERLRKNKAASGRITIQGSRQQSQLVFKFFDDGRGLDVGKIMARARERQLISDKAQLSPSEAANLIFIPGFSTADKLTETSGRGVGMDAIRIFAQEVGGDVRIRLDDVQPDASGCVSFVVEIQMPMEASEPLSLVTAV